jgi:hypothetical protein
MSVLNAVVSADIGRFESAMRGVERTAQRAGKRLKGAFNAPFEIGKRLTGAVFSLQGALAGLGVGLLARDFIKVASSFEQLELQMIAMSDNVEIAKKRFQEMREFAAITPFETEDVIRAYNLLTAFGMEASEKTIETIGGLGLVFGRTVSEVATAFGSLETEVFRRLGIIIDRTGEKWSATMGGMRVEVEPTIEALRQGILDLIEKRLPNALTLAETSFGGLMSTFRSLLSEAQVDIMGAGIFDLLKAGISLLNEELDRLRKQGYFVEIGESIRDAAVDMLRWVESAVDTLSSVGSLIVDTAKLGLRAGQEVVSWFEGLPEGVKEVGVLGLVFGGTAGRAAVLGLAGAYNLLSESMSEAVRFAQARTTFEWIKDLAVHAGDSERKLKMVGEALANIRREGLVSGEEIRDFLITLNNMKSISTDMVKIIAQEYVRAFEGYKQKAGEAGDTTDKLGRWFGVLLEQSKKLKSKLEAATKELEGLEKGTGQNIVASRELKKEMEQWMQGIIKNNEMLTARVDSLRKEYIAMTQGEEAARRFRRGLEIEQLLMSGATSETWDLLFAKWELEDAIRAEESAVRKSTRSWDELFRIWRDEESQWSAREAAFREMQERVRQGQVTMSQAAITGIESARMRIGEETEIIARNFEEMAIGMERDFSKGFVALFQGDLVRAEDAFRNFALNIVAAWQKMIADLIAEAMVTEILKPIFSWFLGGFDFTGLVGGMKPRGIPGAEGQAGGLVRGIGRGDKIPALLSPGEIVLPAELRTVFMKLRERELDQAPIYIANVLDPAAVIAMGIARDARVVINPVVGSMGKGKEMRRIVRDRF